MRDWACLILISHQQKRTFGGWGRSRRRNRNHYTASTWGRWHQKKLQDLSAAPDELNPACREARDFASHFRVSFDIFMFMETAKPVFSVCTHDGGCDILGSRAKIYTCQGRHRNFVGDSAFHTYFGRAPLLVGDTAEVVSPSATSTEFDSV